ncbi:MAG: TrmH family RNA methyltransferase [Clostridia bacterium]|nr:TrmH family RNA methyltransferase [Clostridia bacterium]
MEYKKYTRDGMYSFCLGGFPTFEILKEKPTCVKEITLHDKIEKTNETNKILDLAKKHNIKTTTNSKLIEKLSGKGNIYIMAVFEKYKQAVDHTKNQILLDNPSDMGNLGTIIRVMLGFGYTNLSIIKPCIDIFDPKVIRASMGAIFKVNIELFDSLEDYIKTNHNQLYPFMLQASTPLQTLQTKVFPHTLAFGNEAHGLNEKYIHLGEPLIIKHSPLIDSLNLSMSVGIALYEFNKDI